MKVPVWAAAVAIGIFGALAAWLAPRALPGPATRLVHVTLRVVERQTPIIGPDGRLVEDLGFEVGGSFRPVLTRGTQAP
ncbi:MAG TPA: hypothetical protein VFT43_13525, partial [Candidatus Polarisedimenticolia bacterium]|nr:hypothetical protein [Candidatus Polarisedimenticolia bacterium]